MAVSPDRRILYAASRSKPFSVRAYSIDSGSGVLGLCGRYPSGKGACWVEIVSFEE